MNERKLWYVVLWDEAEVPTAIITDDLSVMIDREGTVVHHDATIRACRMWMEANDINEDIAEPSDAQLVALEVLSDELDRQIHEDSIRQLKERGFDETQIQRVIEHNWLLYTA